MNIDNIKAQVKKQQEKKKDKKDKKLKNSAVVVSRNGIDTIASGLVNPSSNTKTGDVLQIKHVANSQTLAGSPLGDKRRLTNFQK